MKDAVRDTKGKAYKLGEAEEQKKDLALTYILISADVACESTVRRLKYLAKA